ncbi:MAG TPA: F0F1 ATP synthase subunit B [Candidatus Paceibacterota bacterium]|nr:F0F1 ATP synthase subunit B [Candidatus Pacearchaeota archaeon]HRZ51069.1 F0F1 ATP synthase subunit B [Candidatus Paceibacterota bacterium]HSA36772.1 F0F1 ATP synthase subunit B [Candidatus Paceibacterota bacterium]
MEGLGINWNLLVAEIVNFFILLLVLKKFLYKPVLGMLEERRAKIEEGIKKSEEAETSLQKIRALGEEIKEKGEQKARDVMVIAEKRSQEKAKTILAGADEEKTRIIAAAKAAAEQEKIAAKEQQGREAINLAFILAEKVLKEEMNREKDKKIIEKLAKDLG